MCESLIVSESDKYWGNTEIDLYLHKSIHIRLLKITIILAILIPLWNKPDSKDILYMKSKGLIYVWLFADLLSESSDDDFILEQIISFLVHQLGYKAI